MVKLTCRGREVRNILVINLNFRLGIDRVNETTETRAADDGEFGLAKGFRKLVTEEFDDLLCLLENSWFC